MNIDLTSQVRPGPAYDGPPHLALADWRRQINDLYAQVRAIGAGPEAWAMWQQTRSALFRGHPMSPLPAKARAAFDTIALFPYDPGLRFEVITQPVTGPNQDVDVGGDGTLVRRPLARTHGLEQPLGAELTIFWIGGYGGGLFLPFADQSTGDETYGGGRYLLDAIKGADLGQTADGRLILDFNFAYNPSCAMNAAYVCPLAPPENQLPTFVSGGETTPD